MLTPPRGSVVPTATPGDLDRRSGFGVFVVKESFVAPDRVDTKGIRTKIHKQMGELSKITTVRAVPVKAWAAELWGLLGDRQLRFVYVRFFNWCPCAWLPLLALRLMGRPVFVEVATALRLLLREILISPGPTGGKVGRVVLLWLNAMAVYTVATAVFLVGRPSGSPRVPVGPRSRVLGFANGIDVREIRPAARVPDGAVGLIGVGSMNIWHGYDRVLRGLARYRDRGRDTRPIRFELVGDGPAMPGLRSLCRELDLDAHVTFHGALEGEALDRVFLHADLGIGSIGNHRKGLRWEASLKNREYCARGIPFVVEGQDLSFPDGLPWIYRVGSSDEALSIESLLSWYEGLAQGGSEARAAIRAFAERYLPWEVTYRPVLRAVLGRIRRASDRQ